MNLTSDTDEAAKTFREAMPYPHIVIDEYLPDSVAGAALEEVLDLPHDAWTWKTAGDGATISKGSINKFHALPEVVQNVILNLYGEDHLRRLRKLTGIENLTSDPNLLQPEPYLDGGGLHRIERGGRLGIHCDFNTLKTHPHYLRRVNLLLYLNREWRPEWKGWLQLHHDLVYQAKWVEHAPRFNRAVIFETSDHSWHGHPEPLACPADRSRLSIAAYFYVYEKVAPPHRTTKYR